MPQLPRLTVAFLNENALGHRSYLPRFVDELQRRPELGIDPVRIDVTPLPPAWAKRANFSVRGLRRFGLDFHLARWRRVTSAWALRQVQELRGTRRVDALVVNTQSVALDLASVAREVPTLVCLDATFEQLRRSPWFSLNRVAGWFTPLTLAPIRARERAVFASATRLIGWSQVVVDSLAREYGVMAERLGVLPPSLDLRQWRRTGSGHVREGRPELLFVGGDFVRKGGPLLLEAYARGLASMADLHLVTETAVTPPAGIRVHRGLTQGSPAWCERWERASVFAFPSRLETFGIVLLEAMAFEVPVVASPVGVAPELFGDGAAGWLLPPEARAEDLRERLVEVLKDPDAASARARCGRARVERDFDLATNTGRLADWVREAATARR